MASSSLVQLCLFCYKNCSDDNNSELVLKSKVNQINDASSGRLFTVQRFLLLVEKFVQKNVCAEQKNPVPSWSSTAQSFNCFLGCCKNCDTIVSTFCSLYHQLKVLELQLEWKLETLVNIMKFANRVPSRVALLKQVIQDCELVNNSKCKGNGVSQAQENQNQAFKHFRSDFVKTCAGTISRSRPQVVVKRIKHDRDVEELVDPCRKETTTCLSKVVSYDLSCNLKQEAEDVNGNCNADDDDIVQNPLSSIDSVTSLEIEDIEKTENDNDSSSSNDFEALEDFSVRDGNGDVRKSSENALQARTRPLNSAESQPMENLISAEGAVLQIVDRLSSANGEWNLIKDDDNCSRNSVLYQEVADHVGKDNTNMIFNKKRLPPDNENASCSSADVDVMKVETSLIQIENENLAEESARRYNFRQNRKRVSPVEEADDEDSESSHASSHDSDRETSSTSESEDDIPDIKYQKMERKKLFQTERQCFYCKDNGYSLKFPNKGEYDHHQKLHTRGDYKCNFCDVVEKTVIKLSMHEKNVHALNKVDDDDGNGKRIIISCPRCPFQTKSVPLYQCHFASTHFEEFQNCQKITFSEFIRCEMCNLEIDTTHQNLHFTQYHDISSMNPTEIKKCPADDCNAVFREASQLLVHVKNCAKKFAITKDSDYRKRLHGSFKCDFCDIVKDYAPDLALHERQHAKSIWKRPKSIPAFHCARCPSYFFDKFLYIRHHSEEHLNLTCKQRNLTICPICKVEVAEKRYLEKHHRNNHNTKGMDPAQIQRCDLCPAYFIASRQLALHKIKLHFNGKCPECSKFLGTHAASFLKHMDVKHSDVNHFPNFVFRCDIAICKRRYGTEAELNNHKQHESHNYDGDTTMVKCSECGMECKGKAKLSVHISQYHPVNPFICSQCGKVFKTKTLFKIHLEYHKGPEEWKFECPTCGKKCADKQKLEQHKRTHTKEKPHICQFCGEKYAHRHNLKNHMKTKHKKEFEETETVKNKTVRNTMSRKGSKKGDCILAGKKTQIQIH